MTCSYSALSIFGERSERKRRRERRGRGVEGEDGPARERDICILQLVEGMTRLRFDESLPVKDLEECLRIAREMVPRVKEDWTGRELEEEEILVFEVFTNGITNKIFSLFPKGEGKHDRLVFRVFGENTDRIIDRVHELEQWERLAASRLAAPLYATFRNGIICCFLPGRPLTVDSLRRPDITKETARAMARMHQIPMESKEPCTWPKLERFLSNLDHNFDYGKGHQRYSEVFGECFRVDLAKRVAELREEIDRLKPDIAFCHNDLLIHNIIHDEDKGTISFIDYEYADPNYELFDIGNHFNEYSGVDNPDFTRCPTREEKRKWLELYGSFRGRGNDGIEETLDILPLFEAASHLFWAVWALVQAQNSSIAFDYLGYACDRFSEYERKLSAYLS